MSGLQNLWAKTKLGGQYARYGVSISGISNEPEDVNKLKIIGEKTQQVFKPLSLITKKKMFLGGEKDVWECRCGQTNVVADWEYCQKCGNDIYGFKEDEPKPDNVALLVADRLSFLDDM